MTLFKMRVWKRVGVLHNFFFRKYSSSLYVTGDKAMTNFAVLAPAIYFEEDTLQHESKMQENIASRKLNINFDQIIDRWNFFKSMDERKQVLEETKIEIGKTIAELMKNNPQNEEEIKRLKLHLKEVKDDFKFVRDMSYSVEEETMLKILNLPNVLHNKTPRGDSEQIIYSCPEKIDTKTESHFKIGEKYFKYINPMVCYLLSDAAKFELALQNLSQNYLLNSDYIQFSNPDFVRSVVVEGCGENPGSFENIFTLENIHCVKNKGLNKLHLVGSSSLYSFMAYFTKNLMQNSYLPLKAFSLGRNYRPISSKDPSLFNLSQTSNVDLFLALKEDEDVFDSIVNELETFYTQLGVHFRIVLPPAKNLSKSESLRISVEMFSNYLQKYIEVGSVSFYDSYLCKRLLFNHVNKKDRIYPKVIAGSLVNIHKVLGCVIENNSVDDKDLLTDLLKEHIVK